ncbi:MAG TPA: hypothetical protein V6D19_15255 [Stenomitos sp.]
MLKDKCLYVCLAAGLLLGIPLAANAKLGANGTSLNGVSLNGSSYQGTELNASKITAVTSQGIVGVEGGQLVIQMPPIAQ